MNNPLRILKTVDRHLTAPAEITLFGRAALALGYAEPPGAFAATQDVDAILPIVWLDADHENLDFWEAQQRTNAELEPEGLYLTHLFRDIPRQLRIGIAATEPVRLPIQGRKRRPRLCHQASDFGGAKKGNQAPGKTTRTSRRKSTSTRANAHQTA